MDEVWIVYDFDGDANRWIPRAAFDTEEHAVEYAKTYSVGGGDQYVEAHPLNGPIDVEDPPYY
jgi:hypothetical protein